MGLIRDLPHGQIDAFRATLQEAADADLLIHVVDAANPGFPEQMAEVQSVLREIGAADVPQLVVFNKLDALDAEKKPLQMQDTMEVDGVQVPRIFVSAQSGEGLPALRLQLAEMAKAAAVAAAVEHSPELLEADARLGTIGQ